MEKKPDNKKIEYNFKTRKIETNDIEGDKYYCGSIKAYFSTYNTVNYRPDRMVKGCFDKELARWRNGDKLPRFFQQHWGGTIGIIDKIYDDENGMIFEARYINTVKGRDAYIEAKTKATDEYSFSFYVTEFDYDEDGVRNVLEVAGIDEISQVTWGMDPKTKQIEVNSKDLTIRYAEDVLKNAGFSKTQAKTILANGFSALSRDDAGASRDDSEEELNAVFENGLKELNNILKGDSK